MIIGNITLTKTAKQITLSAEVAFKGGKTQHVYFSTDRKNESFVANDASPFLASVLIPCMKTRENIVILGSVNHKLLLQTKKIMTLLNSWNKHLHPVTIYAKKITKDTFTPRHAGTFFSAGVDSFYTYLKNKETIDNFIFVHGFDIELENKTLYQQSLRNIEKIAEKEHRNVIAVETNVKNIIEPVYIWEWIHGGALAAVGLFLRKGLNQLHISGALRKDALVPYGTHPDLDYLWSTEKLHVLHSGTESSRFEKVQYLAKSGVALSYLRVCCENTKGTYNCGHCDKCLRTMIQLEAANALEKTQTFPHKINLSLVRKMYIDYSLHYNVDAETVVELLEKEKRDPELVEAMKESLAKSKHGPRVTAKIINSIARFDQEYNHRRFYTFVFAMNKAQDRNALFKTFVHLGIIH